MPQYEYNNTANVKIDYNTDNNKNKNNKNKNKNASVRFITVIEGEKNKKKLLIFSRFIYYCLVNNFMAA